MSEKLAMGLSRIEELNALGAKFFSEGHLEPARLHFLAALSLDSRQPQVLQNLGAVLRNLQHYEAAASVARRSVAESGNNAFCRSNLGVAQLGLKKFPEALATLKSVVEDMPESGPSWHNYGLVLYMTGRYEEALGAFDKALALDYSNAQIRSDRSLTLLSLGRIQEGLESYEVRWNILHRNKIWKLGIPEWQGEALNGCRILTHHEQGFGDSIMLSRFLRTVAERFGCHITLAVPEELRRLFVRSFRFIKVVNMEDEILSGETKYDYHSPLLSLVRHLKIEKPADIDGGPYIFAKPTELKLPDAKYKVGICWASGNHGPALMERRRVVPLTFFLPLTELRGVSVISLQKGEAAKDIVTNGMEGIVFDIAHRLEDFSITADVISSLDLVISVDSAVAHLAGAIGKECLMLSPYTRCWRWWGGNNGWPWYHKMPILFQSQDGTWIKAIDEIGKKIGVKDWNSYMR